MLNQTETRVSTWIEKEFGLKPKGDKGDVDRVDFFCVAVGGTLHIVEIKRGAHVATQKDILQADKYRQYVLKRFADLTDSKAIKYSHVQSHLIASELHKDAEGLKQAYADKGWVFFTDWDDLIARAESSHCQYKKILETRAAEVTENPVVDNLAVVKDNASKSSKTPGRKTKMLKKR
jgi:hypothetical protein